MNACNAGNQIACGDLNILLSYEPDFPQCNSTTLALMVNRYRDSWNGNGMSCDTLGHLYSYGCGVAKDAEKARQLYSKACTIGNQQGCGRLKEMQQQQSITHYLSPINKQRDAQSLALRRRAWRSVNYHRNTHTNQ